MNKKGFDIVSEAWKMIIPAILLMIISFYVMDRINGGNADATEKNSCKLSVLENAKMRAQNIAGFEWSGKIKCPMQEIVIKDTDDEAVKQKLANTMWDCWDNFGRGKLNLFPTERSMDETFCVICSHITFTHQDQQYTGFMEFLNDHTAPGQKISFYQDFTQRDPTSIELQQLSSDPQNSKLTKNGQNIDLINTKYDYYIVFTYAKKTGFYDKLFQGGLMGAGAGVTIFTLGALTILSGGTALIVASVVAVGAAAYGFATGPDLQKEWLAGVTLIPQGDTSQLETLQCTQLGSNPIN
jgi:hypothetical protein